MIGGRDITTGAGVMKTGGWETTTGANWAIGATVTTGGATKAGRLTMTGEPMTTVAGCVQTGTANCASAEFAQYAEKAKKTKIFIVRFMIIKSLGKQQSKPETHPQSRKKSQNEKGSRQRENFSQFQKRKNDSGEMTADLGKNGRLWGNPLGVTARMGFRSV